MTYKQKLIDLLKSDEQTKTAMEKLEFGCNILVHDSDGGSFGREQDFWYEGKIVDDGIVRHRFPHSDNPDDDEIFEYKLSSDDKIIGLPLQERFIRMYCENKKIYIVFNYNGNIEYSDMRLITKIDNTKDFSEQSDDVYKQIFLALKEM